MDKFDAAHIQSTRGLISDNQSWLASQFATLQEPTPDESPIVIDIDGSPGEIADRIARELQFRSRDGDTASRLRHRPEIP